MTEQPTVVLVHGAFAESSSWSGVIERLRDHDLRVVAIANPLRSLPGDAAYLRSVLATIRTPVVLVGHSYGGMVITEAVTGGAEVAALVYVCAFAPAPGESALELSNRFPGSTLGEALTAYPISQGGNEFAIRPEVFHGQFAADVPATEAAVMSAVQRPVTEIALSTGLTAGTPAWQSTPSWFVYGDADRNIPVALHRFMAHRAAAKANHEVSGASHAISVSRPERVTAAILEAVQATVSS